MLSLIDYSSVNSTVYGSVRLQIDGLERDEVTHCMGYVCIEFRVDFNSIFILYE